MFVFKNNFCEYHSNFRNANKINDFKIEFNNTQKWNGYDISIHVDKLVYIIYYSSWKEYFFYNNNNKFCGHIQFENKNYHCNMISKPFMINSIKRETIIDLRDEFFDFKPIGDCEATTFIHRYIKEKVIIIQRTWRKCRYDPTYKMCETVQLRGLKDLGAI
jgi:hypothetical protein